jgi:hypothetical protein
MGNLPALMSKATPLVSRFFGEISKKRRPDVDVNLEQKQATIIPE